ncbi:MAG: hypothetical protein V4662_22920 [Verrucomicrobiota bacterium]
MDLQQFLYLAAAVVFAFACRTFNNRYLRKVGWAALLAASYMLGFFLTGSHAAGACGIALWFMLPWVEIVVHVRHLRFPVKSEIKGRFPPSSDLFPELSEVTEEIENHGFERVEDTGWKWSDTDHFMRLFYHPLRKAQAAIGMAQQEGFIFSYVSVTSRTQDGATYTTTNYPFPPTMQPPPRQHLNRFHHAESMDELLNSHADYLTGLNLKDEDFVGVEAEQLPAYIERDMSAQIDHNINVGLIELTGEGEFRYSWRGCFFLWFQMVKDMVRI